MSIPDLFALADELGRKLRHDGCSEWQQRIEDAIAAGSTGTEILMALRWNLKGLDQRTSAISADTTLVLNQLLSGIDAALDAASQG